MCGICGYTRVGIHMPDEPVENMKRLLAHRGPDGHGTYSDDGVVLGHRRLAIIDLESGMQPIENENGRFRLVVNGEIYNYQDLRRELENKGHFFSTRSDSEVLVHLWEEYGEEMLGKIRGMYALALWDRDEQILFLARDRYGQKPLYYAQVNNQIVFGSEPKAVLCHPDLEKRICFLALRRYLAYEYVPEPLSIFEHIYKLEAGTYLTWHRGMTTRGRYWDYPLDTPRFKGSVEDCCFELQNHLHDSVRKRLMSDVPLGVFLSGGLDSSLIAALAARYTTSGKVSTFSIGFTESSYDETHYSDFVAKHLKTNHVKENLSASQMLDILPKIVELYDEPFADASAIPTYLVSRLARKDVTVVLSGDGSDELFAGYDPFVAHQISRLFERLPRWGNETILRCINRVFSPSDKNMNFQFKANKFFKYLYHSTVYKNQLWLGCFDLPMQRQCLINAGDYENEVYSGIAHLAEKTNKMHPVEKIIYTYVKTYLRDGILTKIDRAGMAHGLEIRSPFLDSDMSRFIASVPHFWKLRGLTTKFILKKMAASFLPESIINRRKKGFGIPKAGWLRTSLKDYLYDGLNKAHINNQGIFSYDYIDRLRSEHLTGKRDHQKELWTIVIFDMWYQHYMAG